jgi:hypothetical protein
VRPTDGEELDRLMDEQAAYYRALATDYLDQAWIFRAATR